MYSEPCSERHRHDDDLTGPEYERDVSFYHGLLGWLGVVIVIGGLAGWKLIELAHAAVRWVF